jgi:hypothetical protein
MGKIIYAFKIYLLRNEFILEPEFELLLQKICLYLALIYVKAWVNSTRPADAPSNDLNLFFINVSKSEILLSLTKM